MSSLLSAELAATCNALGYYDPQSNKYLADSNTLETVKDLIRYLRRDDESRDIRRQLGDTKVLQTDLLPMLKSYWEETELFDVLLRLLVNLTSPALMLWSEEIPTEKTARNHYLQIVDHLKTYKEAFVDEEVWSVLSRRLSKILECDYSERGDENSLIIERILILIRNILYVPMDPNFERPDNDASVHDQVLWALHQSGMLDIILYMASSPAEQAYYMHILEMFSYMLREQTASELAKAALQRSQTEKIRDEAELLAIRHREANQRQQKIKAYMGARHSRFGGAYVVKSMKSISDKDLIYHKPLNKLDSLSFDMDKKKMKTPKNRMPVSSTTFERRSAFSIRLFLKEFCIEFLNGAYNTYMNSVKHSLVRGKGQSNDESYYLWAMRFFMEFNRCYKFDIKLVSETVSNETFHYVQRQMEKYFDMMQTDKKQLKQWSRRLHIALLAYRELLLTVCAMDKSLDESVKDSAKVIKSNIFYLADYRELVVTLMVAYDELKMSNLYLKDLIETQHIFIKMFETFCNKYGAVIVRGKPKSKKKRKITVKKNTILAPNLNNMWEEIGPQLSATLDGGTEFSTDVVPFDATSEIPIDEQKTEAMKNIQRMLRNSQFEAAIGLLHAAREVWTENDCFGSNSMAKDEEFAALKDIFFADIDDPQHAIEPSQDEEDEEIDDEEDEGGYSDDDIGDREFKLQDFLKRLSHPKIVRACVLALQDFEHNTPNTNHSILKLLHRVAFDSKMYVMLFQLSLFRIFQRVFKVKELPEYKELSKFGVYIIRQFFKVVEKNKKVFIETLFWKTPREAFDIEEGYGSYQQKSANSREWTEEQEDELRRLFMEHREKQLEEDVVDWIVDNLIDNTRSRRVVLKKLKEMMLITDLKSKSQRPPRTWSAEEETNLQELFDEFKDSNDPIGNIMTGLTINRSKNKVIEKMLAMGIIHDKSEVRKRREKKNNGRKKKSQESESESANSDSDSGHDSNNDTLTSNTRKPQTKKGPRNKTMTKKKKLTVHKVAYKSEIIKRMIEIEPTCTEALEWLRESFRDAIEDFEDLNSDDGIDTSIPLVPIMDYAIDAMENGEFQDLLKALGMSPPFDEQETYWRIPTTLTIEDLNMYIELITKALDKTLELVVEDMSQSVTADPNLDDDTEIIASTSNATNRLASTTIDSNDENETFPANQELHGKDVSKKRHRRIINSDSEVEESTNVEHVLTNDDFNDNTVNNQKTIIANNIARRPSKRLRLIDSDEEE